MHEPECQVVTCTDSLPLNEPPSSVPYFRFWVYHRYNQPLPVVKARHSRWNTSESNRTVGPDWGKEEGKTRENRKIDPAYGPISQYYPRQALDHMHLPRWTKNTPCHLRSVSGDGVRYIPVGQLPAARSEALRSVVIPLTRSSGVTMSEPTIR